uniref:DDE Tnp4 domain-containing protein n=1 Tax=Globodera rostochiensis TaxID=31243 RepID=A0A914HQI1_GLORO
MNAVKLVPNFLNVREDGKEICPVFLLFVVQLMGHLFQLKYQERMTYRVAGPDLHFFSLSVRWPGSVNDARVFRNSELCNKFDNGYRPFEGAVLLGDSIYPVKDYLVPMRPYPDLEQFFRAHARARRFIECAMKDPKKSALVIKACVHLHNFIIESRESELDDQELMPDLYQEEGFGRSDPAAADRNLEEEEAEDLAIEEENAFLRNNEMRRIVQKFNEVNKIN